MSNIKDIERRLQEASEAYYNGDAPSMSDAEYDQLRDDLEKIDPKSQFLKQVGAPPSDNALKKVSLTIPMGSLNKVHTVEEFNSWIRNTIAPIAGTNPLMAVQCKYDGSSIQLIYKDGRFVQAVTRGDGLIGEDVTHTIKNAQGFPKTIAGGGDLFVRCEAILRTSDWKQHFPGEKNARNSGNGTVRRTDARGSEHLWVIAFNVLSDTKKWATRQSKIDWLKQYGFECAYTEITTVDTVFQSVEKLKTERPNFPFEIDGMVIHLNDETIYEQLGNNDNRPHAARAWKFPPMGGNTKIESVTWDVGTRGTITPVAVLKPINVGGVTITNVTLHNMDEIDRKDLHVGDEVEIVRAGDVIPYIVRVISKGNVREKIIRTDCPGCGGTVIRDGPFLRCHNPKDCAGSQSKRIKGWISKRDIKFLGDSNLGKLISSGTVRQVPDLYFLTIEKMIKAGIGDGMSKKIMEEIQKSMDVDFYDLVGSLSLDLLGRREAKNIVKCGIVSLEQWSEISPKDLMEFEGYSDVNSCRIVTSLRENWDLVNTLSGMLNVRYDSIKKKVSPASHSSSASGKLSGKSFCFTGKISKPRSEMQSLVENNGGTNFDEVNKSLSYLVIDDPSSESSKAKKARKLNIPMLSESQFIQMIS